MTVYRDKIDELRRVDREGSYEYLMQVTLVGTAISLAVWSEGLWLLVPWFVTVYGLSTIERFLHAREPQPYSRRLYIGYLAMGTAIAVASTTLPVYLWTFEDPIYHYAGLVYQVGAILNTFVVRARAWPSLLFYAIPNAFAMCGIAVLFVLEYGLGARTLIVCVLASWISIYLYVMIRESIARVKTERATTRALFNAQKTETMANFAGGVAHDFNNLLGVVSASLQMAKTTDDETQRNLLLEQAVSAVDRGAGLTKQLLAVGRQSELTTEHVDVRNFVAELERFLRSIIPSSISINVTCEPSLRSIETEPNLLQSMLLNLAMNSRDAMADSGEIDIRVDVVETRVPLTLTTGPLKPGAYAAFSVTDDGRGIPSDVFGRVLEPFFSTRPVGEGTGLGLAMVAGFSKQVGGAMDVSSEEGIGTRVRFFLPLKHDWQRAPADIDMETHPVVSDDPASAQRPRIMLVEDEAALNRVLTLYLTEKGYDVLVCENGDAGMKALETGYVPEILLTDIVMSGRLQGPDLVAEMRRRSPKTLCIMMSGYAFQNDARKQGNDTEVISYQLQKPFSLSDLDKLIGASTAPPTPA